MVSVSRLDQATLLFRQLRTARVTFFARPIHGTRPCGVARKIAPGNLLLAQKTEPKALLPCILQSQHLYIPVRQGLPNTRLSPLSVTPSRVGASHFLWRAPRLAIPGQSTLPVATASGAREGYLASRLVGLRPTCAMPAIAGEPCKFPLRPARASQGRPDQARRGEPGMAHVGCA